MSTPIPTTITNPEFVFRAQGELQYVVCEPLECAGFKNAFSTRLGGVSPLPERALSLGNFTRDAQGDQRELVLENRRRFLAVIGAVNWPLVTAKQIHSAEIRSVVDERDACREATVGDALTARASQILLAIQTADCLPVLIGDERTKAFAAVHAGWRGTLAGIVARTVERMQREYDSRPEDLRAALGPAICAKCFEVGPEVIEAFAQQYEYAEDLVSNRQANGKAHLNINLANRHQLLDCGVVAERIHDSALCTVCRNDLFFSYRRENGKENHTGRLMGVIGLDNTASN